MPRGYVWALYETDEGTLYALRVDADEAQQPERGWTIAEPGGQPPLPRGWTPRVVVGNDDEGHPRKCRVASVSADLWTGAVGVFTIEASDGVIRDVTVTGRRSENISRRP